MSQELNEQTQLTQAQSVIVIHPGSMYVRIGRASDLNPHTELHAIAKRRPPGGLAHRDPILPPLVPNVKDIEHEVDNCRLQVSHMLQSCLMSGGQRRYATPPQQISAFNKRSAPDFIPNSSHQFTPLTQDTIIGDLVVQAGFDYNVFMPMRWGELNVHGGIGGSLTAILSHLHDIWLWIIEHKLNIKQHQLKNYKGVLIVPDIFTRSHLKKLMNLLFLMGFSNCFLVQDHVAAVFGAGLGSACVIDCGHTKTSISCVEDGISQPATRVRLPYGGGDITRCLHWLLNKCGFPYKDCSPDSSYTDCMLLEKIKHNACHVDLDVCGCHEKKFPVVRQSNHTSLLYTIQVADECMIAPLGLFVPELFGLTGPKSPVTQKKNSGDPDDPHDADYLRETGRKSVSATREREEVAGSDAVVTLPPDEDYVDIDTSQPVAELDLTQLFGLDQAILQSIQRCGTDEMKRKMYSSLLIVGGGMKFKGILTWLHNKVSLQVPFQYRTEQMEIVMSCKEMDPTMTAWKGASIMACLESALELWISPEEWRKHSVKVLRERAPFLW